MSTSSREDLYRQAAEDSWSRYVDTRFQNLDLNDASSAPRLADIELDVMQKYLVIARQKRNALHGICKLPSELLVDIFRAVRVIWKPRRLSPIDQAEIEPTYSSGWMSLTHVCSKWRHTAITDAILWTNVDCHDVHPLAFYTILSRCQGRPLKLCFSWNFSRRDGHLAQATENWLSAPLHRHVEALTVVYVESSLDLALLPDNLPNLRNLDISFESPREVIYPGFLTPQFSPGLTRLRLDGDHSTTWESPIFYSSLMHLEWLSNDVYSSYLPVSQFPRFLARMPQLKTLVLHNVLGVRNEVVPPSCSIPSSLDLLKISGYGEAAIAKLFEDMTISATTSVIVFFSHCTTPVFVREVSRRIFQGAFALEQEQGELILNKFRVFIRPWRTDGVLTSPVSHYVREVCIPSDDCYDHYRSIGYYTDLQVENPSLYLPHVPLFSVVAVTINGDLSFIKSAASWILAFGNARNVRRVYMSLGDQATTLCAALEQSTDAEFTLFPALETIVFAFGYSVEQDFARSHLILTLASILRTRREGGAPIREVRVEKRAESWPGDAWVGIRDLVKLSFFG